jgi:hypothetical protein
MATAKKPSTGKPAQGNDTSDQFFKALKAKGSILKKAGAEKAPNSYTTTEEIIEAFKLRIGGKTTTTAKCTAARCGVDKNGNPYVSFNFVCTGSVGAGQTPGKYISLVEQGKRTEEQAYKDLAFTLQRMGYETDDLGSDALKSILDQIKEDRPSVSITISRYGESGIDTQVNRVIDEEDSESEDEEDDSDSDEEEEESEDEAAEESEDEEEEEENDLLENPADWVGNKAKVKTAKMPKAATVTLLSYDSKKGTFKAKNAKGESFTVKVDEVLEA